jgi:hypothetical protein
MADPMATIRRLAKLRAEASTRRNTRRTKVEIPRVFLAFCAWLGVVLTAGQSELARVAFDGLEPVDAGLAQRLFGEGVPLGRRAVVAAVCGARAGKSYVLVALRLVHGMLVRDVSALPPGVRAAALIIAPRDDLRMEVFRYALGVVRSKPELAAMLVHVTAETFTLRRPDGYEVDFKTGVATSGGTAARGQWWTDFALDECAFFRDSSFKVNDEELFRAGSARVLPGGQTIVASTPWAEAGLLHRMWKTRPEDTTVVHAPTLALNDSPTTREIIARARLSDPDNARREFDAEFMTSGTTVFFEGATIDAAMSDDPFEPHPGDEIAAGADFGFLSDSSALVMLAKRGDILHVYAGTEERPENGAPLKPSRTVARFAEIIAGKCTYVMADGHNLATILEHFEEHGLVYAPAPTTPSETHVRARMLLREGRIQIHKPNLPVDFIRRLEQQMREVHGKPTSGGKMSIVYPQWAKGGHGDICAAFVLAVWRVTGDAVPEPLPATGTDAWLEEARERRRAKLLAPKRRFA